jgi:hypothetical protein
MRYLANLGKGGQSFESRKDFWQHDKLCPFLCGL